MRSTNRRQFLQRMAAGGSLLAVPGLLAACGGGGIEGDDEGEATSAAAPAAPESSAASSAGGATSEAGSSSAADVATSAPAETTAASTGELADTLRISNWTLYIDIDEETNERPSLKAFEEEFGVKVEYTEDINSNEEFFGKVQAPLSKGQSIDRDLMVLTDYMAARMVGLGYVEKLDKAAIPNAKNLQPALAAPVWDPNREMSMPWQSGFTGTRLRPREGRQGDHVGRRPDGSEAQGQVHPALGDAGHARADHAQPGPRSHHGRRRDDRPGAGEARGDGQERPPVHGQRLLGHAGARRHLGRASAGRATSPSCRPTTRS